MLKANDNLEDFGNKNLKILDLQDLKLNKEDNVILVLGAESKGIDSLISTVRSINVNIPPFYVETKHLVDSLNVSVFSGIIIERINFLLLNQTR